MQSDSVSTALLSLSCRILWKLGIRIPTHEREWKSTKAMYGLSHTSLQSDIAEVIQREKSRQHDLEFVEKVTPLDVFLDSISRRAMTRKLEAYAKTTHYFYFCLKITLNHDQLCAPAPQPSHLVAQAQTQDQP